MKIAKSGYNKNPLRLLDCKNETCKALSVGAPEIHEHLCEECNTHFEELKTLLDAANIQYNLNPRFGSWTRLLHKNSL